MENNFEVKSFLGMEVRIINREWLVLKDMFSALGRLNARNQISTGDSKRVFDFLELVDKFEDYQKLTIDFKKKVEEIRLMVAYKQLVASDLKHYL